MNDDDIDLEVMLEKRTFNQPGKGRKQCPKCKTYIGARVEQCNCDYVFIKGAAKVTELTAEQIDLQRYCAVLGKMQLDKIVFTPNINCPVRLTSVTKDAIFQWADDIIDYGKNTFAIFTIEALKYFLGQEVGYSTQEYKDGSQYLKEWRESLI